MWGFIGSHTTAARKDSNSPTAFRLPDGQSFGKGDKRLIHDGPYNDIAPWRYHNLAEAFGGGWGCEVRTEGELEEALGQAKGRRGLSLIEVHLGRTDLPENLRRMCEVVAKADKLD